MSCNAAYTHQLQCRLHNKPTAFRPPAHTCLARIGGALPLKPQPLQQDEALQRPFQALQAGVAAASWPLLRQDAVCIVNATSCLLKGCCPRNP